MTIERYLSRERIASRWRDAMDRLDREPFDSPVSLSKTGLPPKPYDGSMRSVDLSDEDGG